MKTCSYCGKQYPDDTAVCPADGESLQSGVSDRKKVTGIWRGVYGYGPLEAKPGFAPVPFTLKLKQGWFSHFDGTVTDDQPQGLPGTGSVDGHFSTPKIEFTKQMPVGYLVREGVRMSFKEYLLAEGHPCDHDLPAPAIFYQGTLLDGNRIQGTWTLDQSQPMFRNSKLPLGQMAGFWCAEFITSDSNASPTGGPTESLFNKSLLSPAELEAVEPAAYVSLEKFNEAEFQVLIERILLTHIRFRTARGDEAGEKEPLEEIFVHPDDLAEAKAILHPENEV